MRNLYLFAVAACALGIIAAKADPLGTAFTYQGQLADNGAPANGSYDFTFALYSSASGGTPIDTIELDAQTVTAGLVNASLDFTDAPYTGQALWVEVGVRGAGGGTFTTLMPRQTINATPYALYALNAPSSGGSLTLPFDGSASSATPTFAVTNTGSGGAVQAVGAGTGFNNAALQTTATSNGGIALYAFADTSTGAPSAPATTAVITNDSTAGGDIIEGWNVGIVRFAVDTEGNVSAGGTVSGTSASANGVEGSTSGAASGVYGQAAATAGFGVAGRSGSGSGIAAPTQAGILADASDVPGLLALSNTAPAVAAIGHGVGFGGSAITANNTINGGTALFAYGISSSSAAAVITNDATAIGGDIIQGWNQAAVKFKVTTTGEVYAHGAFHPNGIDYSDQLPAARDIEPGDVVVIGADGTLRRSTSPNESDVAGVYSTKPGVVGHEESETRATIPVALAGVIPVNAANENGAIRPGDLLVSSSTAGRAMRAPANPKAGTVIGKAMQALDQGTGSIAMLVMLR
jgi:hypothetical protein